MLNKEGNFQEEFRLRIIKPLVLLASPEQYKSAEKQAPLVMETENIIYQIQQKQQFYYSFKAFSWELWGYGFDAVSNELFPYQVVEEQLKLIHLLLSGHYRVA